MWTRALFIAALMGLGGTAIAGEKVTGDALKAAYDGKTHIGVHYKKGGVKTYYATDGSVFSLTEGSKRTGKWWISDGGDKRCVKWDHKNKGFCHYLEKNGDDTHALVHSSKGITLVEVSEIADGDQSK